MTSTVGLAEELLNLRRFHEAVALLEPIVTSQQQTLGLDSKPLAELLQPLAIALGQDGRAEEALVFNAQAQEIFERIQLPRQTGWAFIDRGDLLARLGRIGEARAAYEEARGVLVKSYGEEDDDVVVVRESECEALLQQNQARLGMPSCAEALRRRTIGEDPDLVAYALSLVGRAHHQLGQDGLALEELNRALAVFEASEFDAYDAEARDQARAAKASIEDRLRKKAQR